MVHEQYPAIYTDTYGTEQVVIELEKDEFHLSMTLRGVQFHGLDWSSFYVWPIEQNTENVQRFHLYQGLMGGKEQGQQLLEAYQLRWIMVLPVVDGSREGVGTCSGVLEQGTLDRVDPNRYIITFHLNEQIVVIEGEDLDMEWVLNQLQQQLPQAYIKCCHFCRFSCGEPYGGLGTLCFRSRKDQFRTMKYHASRKEINHLRVEAQIGYVQEIHVCPEFEVDLEALVRVRRQAE